MPGEAIYLPTINEEKLVAHFDFMKANFGREALNHRLDWLEQQLVMLRARYNAPAARELVSTLPAGFVDNDHDGHG